MDRCTQISDKEILFIHFTKVYGVKKALALSILLVGVKFVKIKLIFSFKCLKIF